MKNEIEEDELLHSLDLTRRILDYVVNLCPLYYFSEQINLEQILEKDNSRNEKNFSPFDLEENVDYPKKKEEIKIFAYDCKNENYKEAVEKFWSEPWKRNKTYAGMGDHVEINYRIEVVLTTLITRLEKNKEEIISNLGEKYYTELIKKIKYLNNYHNEVKCQEFIIIYHDIIEMLDTTMENYKKIKKKKQFRKLRGGPNENKRNS